MNRATANAALRILFFDWDGPFNTCPKGQPDGEFVVRNDFVDLMANLAEKHRLFLVCISDRADEALQQLTPRARARLHPYPVANDCKTDRPASIRRWIQRHVTMSFATRFYPGRDFFVIDDMESLYAGQEHIAGLENALLICGNRSGFNRAKAAELDDMLSGLPHVDIESLKAVPDSEL